MKLICGKHDFHSTLDLPCPYPSCHLWRGEEWHIRVSPPPVWWVETDRLVLDKPPQVERIFRARRFAIGEPLESQVRGWGWVEQKRVAQP